MALLLVGCAGVDPQVGEQDPQQSTGTSSDEGDRGPGFGTYEVPVNLGALEGDRFDSIQDAESEEDRSKGGEFFAAPVPFRSPQLGWGLVGLAGYIFRFDPEDTEGPPSTVALGGFYTENDSWMGFGGGRLHLDGDRWRIKAGGGYADIRYDFYGVGTEPGDSGFSLPLRAEGAGGLLEPMLRVAPHWYVGPTWSYTRSETSIRSEVRPPDPTLPEAFDASTGALGVAVERDDRDEQFFPESGSWLQGKLQFYDEAFGSDFHYQRLETSFASYHKLTGPDVLAWRLVWQDASGDVPFFDMSMHDFRGYERGRYRDRIYLGVETEYRRYLFWKVHGVAFAGLAEVAPEYSALNVDDLLPSAGFGVRIRLTEKNRMNYRIDVAWGRNGAEFYFGVGEAF